MSFIVKSKYLNPEQKRPRLRRISWVFLVLILMAVAYGAGAYLPGKVELARQLAKTEVEYTGDVLNLFHLNSRVDLGQNVDFSLYQDVWNALKDNYVDKDSLNSKEMFYGSLAGLAASLGDPYTIYMDPKTAQEFQDDMSGQFEGIGAEIGMRDEIITVIAPLAGSPAEKAGLKAGDKIINIDGESTANLTVDAAVKKIRGEKGTAVTLTVARIGAEELMDIKITRDVIVIKSVTTQIKEGNVYVIKISNFNGDTVGLFNQAVNDIIVKNPKGIVIDLRNDPGGYLDAAVKIASAWVDKGVVVSEAFSNGTRNDYQATGNAKLKGFKTVALVNGGSASASEILAGALKDYKLATIVGEKTYGKGSVQALKGFSDGSALKVTIAKWLTPNGYNINKEGIEPDIEVKLTLDNVKAGEDPQMDKALEILNN